MTAIGAFRSERAGKELDPRTSALLSLEAMLIGYEGRYQPFEYLHYVMLQLERVKEESRPWRLMDPGQYQTFQQLVVEYLGRERRTGEDRRRSRETVGTERRAVERRWQPRVR